VPRSLLAPLLADAIEQGQDLVLIVGRAGSGKTTTARAITDADREAGYEVRGATIPSRTLHSWERAWARGQDHPDRVVVARREAGLRRRRSWRYLT
jgi:ABC-type glutathione transport system ATPase component